MRYDESLRKDCCLTDRTSLRGCIFTTQENWSRNAREVAKRPEPRRSVKSALNDDLVNASLGER
jgi:hypothetical protein